MLGITLLALSLLYSMVFVNSIQSAGVTTLGVVPQSVAASVGQDFSIDVAISNVVNLYGWEFELNWTVPLLQTVNVVEGPFLKAGGSTFFAHNSNDTEGYMIVDDTLTGQVAGATGDGVLATITFYVDGIGQCPLDLHNVTLLDYNEMQIPCQVTGGYGYFAGSHDVAVTNVEVSPSTVLIGNLVNINVTAQDLGVFGESFNVTVYANSKAIGMQPVSLSSGSAANLSFKWDTTTFGKGDYVISASASDVPDEVDTANNNMSAANPVTLLFNGHDIAVTEVQPSKTVVGKGYSLLITVIVKNYGVFSETFNTTIYANATAIYMQVVNLESGAPTTLTSAWNTTNFTYGNYTISAYAKPVLGETDTADNNYTFNYPAHVGVPGDVSGTIPGVYDGVADMKDVAYLVSLFNTKPASPSWKPNADVNNDGVCNMKDIAIAIHYFNNHE